MILDPAKPVDPKEIQSAFERGETIVVPPGQYKIIGSTAITSEPVAYIAGAFSPDPWDRIHDCDRDQHDKPNLKFTKGEIAFWGCLFIACVTGISYLAIQILTAWLKLPLNP